MSAIKDHIKFDSAILCGANVGNIKYYSIDAWFADYIVNGADVCPYCIAKIGNHILQELGYNKIEDMELD